MSDRPLYEELGERPMSVAEREAAEAAWLAENPGQHPAGVRAPAVHLNAEAHERAEAEAAGISVSALRRARAAQRQRITDASRARDDAKARRYVAGRTADPDAAIGRLREALAAWRGDWPPTQQASAEAAGWKDARSVRQACENAGTTWLAELAAARPESGGLIPAECLPPHADPGESRQHGDHRNTTALAPADPSPAAAVV